MKKMRIGKVDIKNKVMILGAALTALAAACGSNTTKRAADTPPSASDMHTSEMSINYQGTYKGVIPAADCPGIEMTLKLGADGSYDLHMKYLERDADFKASGEYAVEGNLLTLEGSTPGYYKIEENRLRYLDAEKKPIEGELAEHYILNKTDE